MRKRQRSACKVGSSTMSGTCEAQLQGFQGCATNRQAGYGLIFSLIISGYSRVLILSISRYKLIPGLWKSGYGLMWH